MESEEKSLNMLVPIEVQQLEFEKYKLKIELFKWSIVSVALVIVTMIIDYGFRDRAAGLQEIEQYDKYITELIVLNKEPGQKRMLAQFFANVTPSEKLKKGWDEYYKEVDKEYQVFIAPVIKNNLVMQENLNTLYKQPNPTSEVTEKIESLTVQIENNKRLISPEIVLPSSATSKDYQAAIMWESKGFSYLLAKDVENAINSFQNSENVYNSFHQVYEIANYLRKNSSELKNPNSELWAKTYTKIAKDYAWKMPDNIRAKLLQHGEKI